ncbi:MAG: hypothetical protein GY801_06040 [bacterium]|nr:hypothetical protein [bacterium]
MTNEDIIESVLSILALDGSVSKWEMQYFSSICERLQVSQEAKNAALTKTKQGKGRIHLPDNEADKNRLLYFLTQAAVADGKVVEKERRILYKVVDKLQLSRDYVDNFIDSRLQEIKNERYSTVNNKSTIKCPKCEYEQPKAYKCKRCGIIFEKYKQVKELSDEEPSDTEKLMKLLSSSNKIVSKD